MVDSSGEKSVATVEVLSLSEVKEQNKNYCMKYI